MGFFLFDEKGIVLPIVIVLITVISLLGFTAIFIAESQTAMTKHNINRDEALYYAEAGFNRYLWHLNDDSRFYLTPAGAALQNVDIPFYDGFFRLQVTPPNAGNPVVTVTSTGWLGSSPDNSRIIQVAIRKREFVQNVYGTNWETTLTGTPVWWIKGDIVNGPLHTNGILNIDGTSGSGTGPDFFGPVTYSEGIIIKPGGTEQFHDGSPEAVPPLVFPLNNLSLRGWAEADGYLYQGRTFIMVMGDQLKIRNGDDSEGQIQYRPLPPNGVIYVDGTVGGNKFGLNTGNAFVSGTLNGRLTIAAANDIYITAWDPTDWRQSNLSLSENNYTGGILYADQNFFGNNPTSDMLGLVANRYVRIMHKNWPKRGSPYFWDAANIAPDDITIHAAIFALNYSFEFEKYEEGSPRGTINLVGSIIQNARGGVGTFWSGSGARKSGYLKDYTHDPRMAFDAPPHFLQPLNSGWEIVSWQEIKN